MKMTTIASRRTDKIVTPIAYDKNCIARKAVKSTAESMTGIHESKVLTVGLFVTG